MDTFLTKNEKEELKNWKYKVDDKSITTKIFTPFWNILVSFVPETVAPNILSLAGFLFILYSFNLAYNYIDKLPNLISFICLLMVFSYMNIDAIDGKHARRIKNTSPLGELFDHSCDNIGTIFLVLTLCLIIGITSLYIQWFIVQSVLLLFLNEHVKAFITKKVTFGFLSGPVEALCIYMLCIIIKIIFGFEWLDTTYINILTYFNQEHNYSIIMKEVVRYMYYTINLISLIKFINIKDHNETRNGLSICLLIRFVPSILLYLNLTDHQLNLFDVISDGLFMSVMTSDMIVSKMANRELHPWIIIFAMMSLFDNLITIIITIFYHVSVFCDISNYMRIPMFSVYKNVLCLGVFDLTHLNHKKTFKESAQFGTKLFVGVHSDEVVNGYKERYPVMDEEYRYEDVENCKYVDVVLKDAPIILNEEFINENNIHVVIGSDEYDTEDDKYYKVAREMGIFHIIPRKTGISTSEIKDRLNKEGNNRF
jgi:cytidyltransferase-like protein